VIELHRTCRSKKARLRIGIISFPLGAAGTVPIRDLVRLLVPLTDRLTILTGGDAYERLKNDSSLRTKEVVHFEGSSEGSRVIKHLMTQLRIARFMLTEFSDVESWVFFIGGDSLVIPLIVSRLTGRRTILMFAGSASLTQKAYKDPLEELTRTASFLACSLSNKIVLYSQRLKSEWQLERYSSKISIANHHFPDYDMFRIKKPFVNRENTIGYVGRLSEEKGVMNLIRAAPHLMTSKPDIELTIAGDGPCRKAILDLLNEQGLDKKVSVLGWVPHDQLPELLNELRLIVVPSSTEGLPNVILEAMGCGTPVLATAVGAIPDVIENGRTGFLMETNSPECILRSILRAIDSPGLQEVSQNARELVANRFNYQRSLLDWKAIIQNA